MPEIRELFTGRYVPDLEGQGTLWLRKTRGETVTHPQTKGTLEATAGLSLRPANLAERYRQIQYVCQGLDPWRLHGTHSSPYLRNIALGKRCFFADLNTEDPEGHLDTSLFQRHSQRTCSAPWVMCRNQNDGLTTIPSAWTVSSLHFLISLLMVAFLLSYKWSAEP